MACLYEFEEFVEFGLVEVVAEVGADGVLDLALLDGVADPGVGLGVPDDGVDLDRKMFVGEEEVDECSLGTVVSPLWVLSVRLLGAELLGYVEQLGEVGTAAPIGDRLT